MILWIHPGKQLSVQALFTVDFKRKDPAEVIGKKFSIHNESTFFSMTIAVEYCHYFYTRAYVHALVVSVIKE